jgi:thymidylate synthase
MVNPLMLKLLYLKMFITAIFKFGLADFLHEKKNLHLYCSFAHIYYLNIQMSRYKCFQF